MDHAQDASASKGKHTEKLLSDMTALRDAAAANGRDLDAMLDAIVEPMVVYDLQSQVIRANEAFQSIVSLYSQDPTAASLQDRADALTLRDLHGDALPDDQQPQQRLLHGEVITGADPARIITRNASGREGVYSITGGLLYRDNAVIGTVMFFRDITQQQQMEHDLQQRGDELQVIFDALVEPIFIYDAFGQLLRTNAAARRLLPLVEPTLAGARSAERDTPSRVRDAQDQPLPQEQWPIARLLRGETLHGEQEEPIRVDLPDKGEAWLTFTGAPTRDADGRISGYVALGHDSTQHEQAKEELQFARDELEQRVAERTAELMTANRAQRRLSRQVLEVQETERRRIAQELHDEIGQALTAIKMMLETQKQSGDQARLDAVRATVAETLERVRGLSLDLRPAILDNLGLLPALQWYFERYTQQTDVQVAFQHSGLEQRLATEIETGAFRLAQEALTNVARHAGVDHVTVQITATDEALHLFVVDEGTGFDAEEALAAGLSTGLLSMRERATLLGGAFLISSMPGEGTTIEVDLPFPPDSELSVSVGSTQGDQTILDPRTESERNSERDTERDTSRDLARDVPRDVLRDVARDSARDTTRDTGRDRERDTGRDITRDVARDVARDTARDTGYEKGRSGGADGKQPKTPKERVE